MSKYCPHCKAEIATLNYVADYSEIIYGRSSGYYDIDDESNYVDDTESRGSDNFEEEGYEYTCPECGAEVEIEDLQDEDNSNSSSQTGKLIKFFEKNK